MKLKYTRTQTITLEINPLEYQEEAEMEMSHDDILQEEKNRFEDDSDRVFDEAQPEEVSVGNLSVEIVD